MMDTFNEFSVIDINDQNLLEDREVMRKRLLNEDAARRPWLLGPAIRKFHYRLPQRIWFVLKETFEAARWSWRLSK